MAKAKFKAGDLIGEILMRDERVAEILLSFGFHCLGCPTAQKETIKQACEVHGVDVKELLKALNALK